MSTETATRNTSAGSLAGQTVVVIGGSSGIGLETAKQARSAGADLIVTGRNRPRLDHAREEVGAQRSAILDLKEAAAVEPFFAGLPADFDHVFVTGGGPPYSTISDLDFGQALDVLDEHLLG